MKNSPETKQFDWTNSLQVNIWDVFQLWDHFLACGDCKDAVLLKRLFGRTKYSLLLTDPPYWVDYVASKSDFMRSSEKHVDIVNDWFTSDEKYSQFTTDWIVASLPYLEKTNSMYIFNSDKMLFALREWMKWAWVKFSQLLVWIKNSAVIGRLDYLPQHELIAYGWKWKHKFHGSQARSILAFPRTKKNTLHPTMKPIGLLRELILNSSNVWDIIYDPFGWSGSTLIASEQTKRCCYMIEVNITYCERIIHRWEKLTGNVAKKIFD
jgi:DNA modification methylase